MKRNKIYSILLAIVSGPLATLAMFVIMLIIGFLVIMTIHAIEIAFTGNEKFLEFVNNEFNPFFRKNTTVFMWILLPVSTLITFKICKKYVFKN